MRTRAWIGGATAATLVGASFPVSEALTDYPYATGQMLRYALGAAILTALAKGRIGRPTKQELVRLALVAAVGMVGFNLAVLAAVDHVGATNTGVIVGASPVILAVTAATKDARLMTAAVTVVAGAAIVNGADPHINAVGTLAALAALAGEVGFTLLAAPLLPRLGAQRTATWAAWLATVQLALIARTDIPTPSTAHLAAIAYLALFTTAVAFVLWFNAVRHLGSGTAGLLIGLMPVAAVAVDALLDGRAPATADIAGTALVAAGVAIGATSPRTAHVPVPAHPPVS